MPSEARLGGTRANYALQAAFLRNGVARFFFSSLALSHSPPSIDRFYSPSVSLSRFSFGARTPQPTPLTEASSHRLNRTSFVFFFKPRGRQKEKKQSKLMAMDDEARASSPPTATLDHDHPAPPSATSATTTALDLTNEHLPTLDGVELPETLEVRRSFQGEEQEVSVSVSFVFSSRGAHHGFFLSLLFSRSSSLFLSSLRPSTSQPTASRSSTAGSWRSRASSFFC